MRIVLSTLGALLVFVQVAVGQTPTGVSLGSPAAGAVNVPTTVVFTWTGGDRAQVYEVLLGTANYPTTIVATVPVPQRTYTAGLAPATKYYWRIRARSATGKSKLSASRSFTTAVNASPPPPPPPPPPVNQPPTVSLSSTSTTYAAPATIPLMATVSDPDGILRVEFLLGDSLLGLVMGSTPPYTLTWMQATPGTYPLTVRAYDLLGAGALSAPLTITVTGGSTPPPPPPPSEFCSDRVDNDKDGQVDEDCPSLPSPVCTLTPTPPTSLIGFTPAVLDYYTNTSGYVLEVESATMAPQSENLGKGTFDRPLDPLLKDFRVQGCATVASPLLSGLPAGNYTAYLRACKVEPPENQPGQNPFFGYKWCSSRSVPAPLSKPTSSSPVTLRMGQGLPPPEVWQRRVEFLRGRRVVSSADVSFTCAVVQVEPQPQVFPTLNPVQLVVGVEGRECRADVQTTIRMLAPGDYMARVRGSSAVTPSFTVKR